MQGCLVCSTVGDAVMWILIIIAVVALTVEGHSASYADMCKSVEPPRQGQLKVCHVTTPIIKQEVKND